ncbi:MAG TPA: DinB family protein [Vicinamibacterales bacterium]|nr:DinB family protein [Vicinamibacterales bacterium]
MSSTSMHPRLQELFAYLSVRRTALREAVEAVPEGLRDRQPAADRWSVAEVLEHLGLVEERFKTIIADRLAEARASGLGAERETSPIVPTLNLAGILDRSSKHQAPDVVRPQGSDWKTAWSRLEDIRRSFLGVYGSGDGLALADVVHVHPRLGSLNLYQWGVWVGGHEARHTEQIREIAATLNPDV